MTMHTGNAFKKLLKFRTIQAFSSKLGTKIENPENIGNCVRPVCGPDSSSCQTARTIAFRANREAITLGSNG